MANYLEMNREELTAEKAKLNEQYKKFLAMNLKLNMARGKPGPHQMDLAMGLLQMNDYTTDAGTDARNYGDLEGLHEARVLFADVFGVKPEEVFVGGNSSLQLMYNLINIGYVFGFPESPCPWSQVEKRKFLCPVPGYDRHFAITEEYGFELISVPMTPNGPDMDIVEKLVAEDDTIKGIWCVPQYSNPDGYTYSDETIDRMAKMKTAAPDFKIFWDEAYIVHHLTEEIIETPVLLNESKKYGTENRVFMFTSTSKITFPGAGVSAIACSVFALCLALAVICTCLVPVFATEGLIDPQVNQEASRPVDDGEASYPDDEFAGFGEEEATRPVDGGEAAGFGGDEVATRPVEGGEDNLDGAPLCFLNVGAAVEVVLAALCRCLQRRV